MAFLRRARKRVLPLTAIGLILVSALACEPSPDPGPPAPPSPANPGRETPAPPPRIRTLDEKIDEAMERDRSLGQAYRTRHRLWTDLLAESSGTKHEAAVREHLELLQSAANKAHREAYRPIQEAVRTLLGDGKPAEARAKLAGWSVPAELDIDGSKETDRLKELAALEEHVALVEECARLTADPAAINPENALARFLNSPHVSVRTAAERVAADLRIAAAMAGLRREMEQRRTAAIARVDRIRKEAAQAASTDLARLSAWERRLREASRKKPFPVKTFGLNTNQTVHVSKFDGRTVTFAGDQFELGLGLDELQPALYGEILLMAADPASPRDLLEAGRLAVRRGAWPAARTLFDQAAALDRSLAVSIPDLERITRGVASLRGSVSIDGGSLALKYDFVSNEQEKDFVASPEGASVARAQGLRVAGSGLFFATQREALFQDRLRIRCEAAAPAGAGLVLGVRFEAAPGEDHLLVALLEPSKGIRILTFIPGKEPAILHQGTLDAWGPLEAAFDGAASNVKVGGAVVWAGRLETRRRLAPVIGAYAFNPGALAITVKNLSLEGQGLPARLRSLRAERSAILEAELARDFMTTRGERASDELDAGRTFGIQLLAPIPLEGRLAAIQPERVRGHYAGMRHHLARLAVTSDPALAKVHSSELYAEVEQAVQEAPWFPLSYYYRAELNYAWGDVDAALADLARAVQLQPAFVEARTARSEVLMEQHRFDDAGKELDAALDMVPDLAAARLTRSLLHYYSSRTADALAEIDLALRLEPGNLAVRRQAKRLRNAVSGPLWSETAAVTSAHYTLKAEVPKSKPGKNPASAAVKQRLEKFSRHLEGVRANYPRLLPGKAASLSKPVLYLFSSAEGYYVYADFTQEDRLEHTLGCFLPTYRQLLFFEGGDEAELIQTMAHEAFHEYLQTIAPQAPIWFNEGMAEYASSLTGEGVAPVLSGRLVELRETLEAGWSGLPFELIMHETQDLFYRYAPSLQYAQAWSMIHFLRHGGDARYTAMLDRYARLLGEGKGPADAFRETFGKADLTLMHREWRAYVRNLR